MNLRRTRAVFLKEFRHIQRDARSLILALALPVLMLVVFGFALSLDVDRIPTLIYDGDQTALSRELIERFRGSRFFRIRGFAGDYKTIETEIDHGRILMGIAIPRDYSRKVASGRPARVQVLLDGSDSNTASIAKGYVEAVVRSYSASLAAEALNRRGGRRPPAIDYRQRVWYNPSLESKNFVVPGLIAVILMIIASLLTSLTIAREWEMGTMEQLLSTPLRPAELVLGKMGAFFVVGIADTAIAVAAGVLVFHVPFRGSLLFLAVTSAIFLTGALFWGIFVSVIAGSQLLAYQIGILTSFLPALLLSGFIYSIGNMPHVVQVFTYVVPARYFITILKGVFLKGVGFQTLYLEVAFLAAYAVLVFLLATWKLRRKLA
jgi:ABC-2 type transport system permease protein